MDDLPAWIEVKAWEGFIAMRKSIKKPLTERAKVLAIHKLETLLKQGQDPTKVLDQSTFNSWQGLFAVKEDYGRENGGSGRPGRNFAEEDERNRRERNARILANSHPLARDVHKQKTLRIGHKVVDGEAVEISPVEANADGGLHGTTHK